jgi:4-amino-4-deoxy-L-arabinose transferase-like glycosyltransferase
MTDMRSPSNLCSDALGTLKIVTPHEMWDHFGMQITEKHSTFRRLRRPYLLLTCVAIVIATFLRFAWVASQGFMEYDEGWLVDSASSMSLRLRGGPPEIYIDFKASPVTSFLTAVPIAVWGKTAASIMYPPALLGLLGVIATAIIALRLYGSLTAVITLLICAVSPMQVLFSRTAAIDTPGFFFLGMAYVAIVWYSPRQKLDAREAMLVFASGILLSLSLAANYRVLSCIFLPALLIIIREGIRLEGIKKLFLHLAGFAGGLIFVDLTMRFVYPPPISNGFWGAFIDQYQHISGKTFGQGSPSLLPSLHIKDGLNLALSVMDLDNVPALALMAVWILLFPFLIWRGTYRVSDLQLGALVIIPVALFSLLTQTAARGLTVTQPFFALAAARAIIVMTQPKGMHGFASARGALLVALVAVVTGAGFYKSIQPDVLGTRNAFDLAFRETCVKHNTGVILELDRGPGFYAAPLNCKTTVVGMEANTYTLAKMYLQGHRFWLIDGQFSAYFDRFRYLWPSFENRTPDLFIPAETYIRLDHFTSHALWLGSTYAKERKYYEDWIAKWGARLPVFDLSKHIVPLEWRGGSDGWYRVGDAIVAMPSTEAGSSVYKVALNSSQSGSGAEGRFNIPDYLERSAHFGLGMCESGSTDGCNGFGFFIVANNTGLEAKLLTVTPSKVEERTSISMPKTFLKRESKVWMKCDAGTLTAGFNDTTAITYKLSGECRTYHPAFIAQSDMPLEALEMSPLS